MIVIKSIEELKARKSLSVHSSAYVCTPELERARHKPYVKNVQCVELVGFEIDGNHSRYHGPSAFWHRILTHSCAATAATTKSRK